MNLINNLTKSAAMLSVITLLGQSFVLADPSIQLKGEFNGAWTSSSGDYSTTNEQEDGNLDIIDIVNIVNIILGE